MFVAADRNSCLGLQLVAAVRGRSPGTMNGRAAARSTTFEDEVQREFRSTMRLFAQHQIEEIGASRRFQ
jgi:hypothetical protein